MKRVYQYVPAIAGIVLILSGCGNKKAEINSGKNDTPETVTRINAAEEKKGTTVTVTESNAAKEELFPSSYNKESGNVKFSCQLEVPKEFEPDNFHDSTITGIRYIDRDKAYADYVEGKDIDTEYHYPSDDGIKPDDESYTLKDGTQVVINGSDGFIYATTDYSTYGAVMRENEAGASHDNFDFGSGEDSVGKVRQALSDLSYPVDEYKFNWFSISGEEHKSLQQAALENGVIGSENLQDDWTGKNEYEIYAWQIYGGLPVFPQIMTSASRLAWESYKIAPVSATYTENGFISLRADHPYMFEQSDDKVTFLPFDEIANAVAARYENILTDSAYTVNRAKLAYRVYLNEKQQFAAEPIWYFESSDDNGGAEVLLFNAETGKEIFLN